uniref:Fidgetin n=1 Tax=Anas platyrhynchos TaxID=8839 RepID=A0A8B9TE71_ANAPL
GLCSAQVEGLLPTCMHWSPEHAQSLNQWPEQHLDVSSTTSSPAHKSDLYPSTRQRFNYAWANDDISALTASNLLKRYAEKYSGVLDAPYERPALSGYGDGAFGPVNGQKGDGEPWPVPHGSDGAYPLTPIHDGLPGAKAVVPPAVPAGSAPLGLGGSPVVSANLADPIYPGNSCGGAAGSGGLGSSQEYPAGYGGTYLPSGYCAQPSTALAPPHPPALHGSGLLQPTHPSSALVPGYGSSGPVYNYASGSYAPQPGYGAIHPPHPSASYLPSGIAAPTPLPAPPPAARLPVVPAYGYQGAGLAPLAVPPLGTEAAGALKRKAFDISGGEDEAEGRYRKYSYEQPKSPYPMSDNGECRGNGFRVPPMKSMVSPPYGTGEAPLRPAEPFEKFSPPLANWGAGGRVGAPLPAAAAAQGALSSAARRWRSSPKTFDPLVLELVNTKIVERGPPVQWTDIAGQVSVKATIEEELVWPILRPGAYTGASRPPRTILLFGPRGTGKTLLSRCISTQLGSTLLKLSGTALLSTWKAEAEKILQTVFFVAKCRQPSVVLLTEAEALLVAQDSGQAGNLKSQLLSYLDNVATSAELNVVIIGTTSRPGSMDEASHRRFAKRFYISPPDSIARRQILHHVLAQQGSCLSEREMASLVQHTESFSGGELIQLCQHAGATTLHGLPGQIQPTSYKDFEKAFCKVRPATSQKELDLFAEWDKMYGSRH